MTNLTKLAIYGQLANVTDAMSMVRRARVLSTMSMSVGVICTYARARACAGEELARACAFTQRSNRIRHSGIHVQAADFKAFLQLLIQNLFSAHCTARETLESESVSLCTRF